MANSKPSNFSEVKCPYCGDFYGYIVPENFFWGDEEETTVHCNSMACGKPFIIER